MYIKKLDLFLEAKNIGTLYHFTSLLSLYSIIRYDEMISLRSMEGLPNYAKATNLSPEYIYKYYISFTRNKNFDMDNYSKWLDTILSCRIDFNGNKLSNKHSIKPVSFYSNKGKYDKSPEYSDESEEMIILNSDRLKDVVKYIDNINICDATIFYKEMTHIIEYGDTIEYTFNLIKSIIKVDNDIIDTIQQSPDKAHDLFNKETSDLIYNSILEYLKSKFPNLKTFKSKQSKLSE